MWDDTRLLFVCVCVQLILAFDWAMAVEFAS